MRSKETARADDSSVAEQVATMTELLEETSIEPSAAERVFATTELLEKILLHVADIPAPTRLRTVLLSQRINSMFRNTIQNSNAIRRDLMLLPQPDGHSRSSLARINPLLAYPAKGHKLVQDMPFIISYKKRTTTELELRIDVDVQLAWAPEVGSWRDMFVLDAPHYKTVPATVFVAGGRRMDPRTLSGLQLDTMITAEDMMEQILIALAARVPIKE